MDAVYRKTSHDGPSTRVVNVVAWDRLLLHSSNWARGNGGGGILGGADREEARANEVRACNLVVTSYVVASIVQVASSQPCSLLVLSSNPGYTGHGVWLWDVGKAYRATVVTGTYVLLYCEQVKLGASRRAIGCVILTPTRTNHQGRYKGELAKWCGVGLGSYPNRGKGYTQEVM